MNAHRCPECGAPCTLGDGPVYSAPVERLVRAGREATGEFLRESAPVITRTPLLMRWVGCNACDWCGPASAAREEER